MGAANSREPRSVSMENPTPASSVIDVSDEVVERLKKGLSKQVKESAPPPKPAPAASPRKEEKRVPIAKPATPPPARAPTVVYQNPAQVYVPTAAATLSSMDVYRQKELELNENDAIWRKRLEDLEETLKKTNSIMESEYTTAVDGVKKRFATASARQQLPPCQDLKAQLIACYRAHPGETLLCSEEVANFRQCVDLHRVKKLEAADAPPKAADAPPKAA